MTMRMTYELQLALLQAERDAAIETVAQLDNECGDWTKRLQLANIKLTARDKLIHNLREQIAVLEETQHATDALLLPPNELQETFEQLFLDQIDLS